MGIYQAGGYYGHNWEMVPTSDTPLSGTSSAGTVVFRFDSKGFGQVVTGMFASQFADDFKQFPAESLQDLGVFVEPSDIFGPASESEAFPQVWTQVWLPPIWGARPSFHVAVVPLSRDKVFVLNP